jgi:hypothetical protein
MRLSLGEARACGVAQGNRIFVSRAPCPRVTRAPRPRFGFVSRGFHEDAIAGRRDSRDVAAGRFFRYYR